MLESSLIDNAPAASASTPVFVARRLVAEDIPAMAAAYRSRDKLMLRPKGERQRNYPRHFSRMLNSGCEAYGTFVGDELQAFCIVSPWRDMPFFAFLLVQSRPTPGPVDLRRNGLAYCIDAALESLEARGYTHMVYQRIDDPKWRTDVLLRTNPAMRRYAYTVIESVPAGQRSRWGFVNDRILFGRPAAHDVLIVVGARRQAA